MESIPFNKPYFTGKETMYMTDAVKRGHISGNGHYTKLCQNFFEKRWGFRKCLMTTSCTDALEMCALLLDIKPGDEVIMPSFTFVSTAIAFIRQGAIVKFVDSREDHPGMDESKIEEQITSKTKAIIVVHYAGVAVDMDYVIALSKKHNLVVVEDAAQAINSFYKGRPLGGIGHLGCFSFHETKNLQCGEGGMLVINDEKYLTRAEIIWEKGTNRAKFFRGEIDKYGWVDIGSSFLPSDLLAAFLWAQLEELEAIQARRKEIWDWYYDNANLFFGRFEFRMPLVPNYATNNAHMFYLNLSNLKSRNAFVHWFKSKNICPVFHYQSLHKSPYYKNNLSQEMPFSENYSDTLIRMPFYYDLPFDTILRRLK